MHFPGLFDAIMGNSPAIHRKPAPDMLDRILHDLSIPKEQAVYIGDSEVDIETAKTPALPASPSHGASEIKASSPAMAQHASQKMQRSWPWNWE